MENDDMEIGCDHNPKRLKEKCEQLEKELLKQKQLTGKAIAQHETLIKDYDGSREQRSLLETDLAAARAKVQALEMVLEPAAVEFSDLRKRFEIESDCRSEAEKYASKLKKQNVELKRKSQDLIQRFQLVDSSLEEQKASSEGKEEEEEDDERTALNKTIQSLRETVKDLEQKLVTAESEKIQFYNKVQELEFELKILRDRQKNDHLELRNFRHVSQMACLEYEDLQAKLESEISLKLEAEKCAHDLKTERDTLKQEVEVLKASTNPGEQLKKALVTVSELTAQHASEKLKLNVEVEELKQTISSNSNNNLISELEAKLQIAADENARLQQSVDDLEKWKEKLDKENRELSHRVDEFEKRLRPPTPPPLPAPLTFSPLKLIIRKKSSVGGATKGGTTATAVANDAYGQALKEMMERIETGQSLRHAPPRQIPVTSEFKAITKLQEMLGSLRSQKARGMICNDARAENESERKCALQNPSKMHWPPP